MAQVTIYLDEETVARMRAAARDAGMSQSRWIAGLIRTRTAEQWPAKVLALAGSWADDADVEESRAPQPADTPREPM